MCSYWMTVPLMAVTSVMKIKLKKILMKKILMKKIKINSWCCYITVF